MVCLVWRALIVLGCRFIRLVWWSFFFFSSRRRHTRSDRDWSSDVCSSDLSPMILPLIVYAVAIYAVYSRLRLVGTDVGLIIAHTIMAVPFVFVTVTAALRSEERRVGKEGRSRGSPYH